MIQLENVTKVFQDGTKAVDGLSFTVEEGELCVLLGPSGCGKTTTMKMINRLEPLTEGRILLGGKDILDFEVTELRRQIGYAIQEIGLFPHMTVGENIEVVPQLRGWPKQKRREQAERLLEMVRLPKEFIDRYPKELSGGQRQRVGVARALGADPEVLLMDEPFGAIDPITRVELQNEFLRIQGDIKKTIVFVTHDIYEAIKMGDKIALMDQGRLVQYDSPINILFQPKDRFVADFVGRDRALKALQLIRVKAVMSEPSTSARMDEAVEEVKARLGRDREGASVPLVDEKGAFKGFLDLKDAEGGKAADCVRNPEATVHVDSVLDEALSVMLSGERRTLGIVDNEMRLKGLLSFGDIQRALGSVGQEGSG